MIEPPQVPAVIYAAFSDFINQATLQRAINGLTNVAQKGAKEVHVFFQSAGGNVGDGLALYNFFRAYPISLTLYNPGQVASIAVVAYLGAKHRKASAHAVFQLHRTTNLPSQPTGSYTLRALADSTALDDARTEAVIRAHTTIPDDRWAQLDKYDVFIPAPEAVKYGIADEIGEFSPPPGTQIFSV
ncbi:MAG: ATP-dependent Clp protease proteolytic subunit [Candidatus Eremiobacteraeota bacterium]|nr:ATP-dependent Clp protease proteolytic subunit [Candidatus Eremiobacteraeota bacterium]